MPASVLMKVLSMQMLLGWLRLLLMLMSILGHGIYKINVDEAIASSDAAIGTGSGGLVRDDGVLLMDAFDSPLEGSVRPLVAELLALRQGLQFASQARFWRRVRESDCNVAVSLVKENTQHELRHNGAILTNIHGFLCEFQFIDVERGLFG